MSEFRAFAYWQQGAVRFLASPDAPRVEVRMACREGHYRVKWHHLEGVSLFDLARAASAGILVRLRMIAPCPRTRVKATLDISAARCADLLVARDAWLEAGCPHVKAPRTKKPSPPRSEDGSISEAP